MTHDCNTLIWRDGKDGKLYCPHEDHKPISQETARELLEACKMALPSLYAKRYAFKDAYKAVSEAISKAERGE